MYANCNSRYHGREPRIFDAIVPSMTLRVTRFVVALLALMAAVPACAHTGSLAGGFIGGFAHPVFGPDHVVAMVAVGLWGAFLGRPAIFLLPVIFPLVMAAGGVLGGAAAGGGEDATTGGGVAIG